MDGTELYREHFFFRNTNVLPREVQIDVLKICNVGVIL
jgi:hypothetical protein